MRVTCSAYQTVDAQSGCMPAQAGCSASWGGAGTRRWTTPRRGWPLKLRADRSRTAWRCARDRAEQYVSADKGRSRGEGCIRHVQSSVSHRCRDQRVTTDVASTKHLQNSLRPAFCKSSLPLLLPLSARLTNLARFIRSLEAFHLYALADTDEVQTLTA